MIKKTTLLSSFAIVLSMGTMSAQSYEWVSSTENNTWQQSKVKLQTNTGRTPLLEVNGSENGTVFKAWGCTQHASTEATGNCSSTVVCSRRRSEVYNGTLLHECQRLRPRLVQLR